MISKKAILVLPISLMLCLCTITCNDDASNCEQPSLPNSIQQETSHNEANGEIKDTSIEESSKKQITEDDIKGAEEYAERASFYTNNKMYEDAIREYDKAIALNPNNARYYINRSTVYRNIGDYNNAILDCDKVIGMDSEHLCEAYSTRAEIYLRQKDYKRAISDLTKSIEIEPDLLEVNLQRAQAYYENGEYENAINDFNHASEILKNNPEFTSSNPVLASIYEGRGNSYYSLEEYRKAIDDFSSLLEIKPEYPYAYLRRALAYYHQANYNEIWYDEVIHDSSQIINLGPSGYDDLAYLLRGLAYMKQGQMSKAKADFQQCIVVSNSPNIIEDAEELLKEIANR